MEGQAAASRLTERSVRRHGCVYAVATRADEPVLRELLRTNSLGGWIQLAFEREPDAFAATFGLARSHDFIITYDERTGTPVGLGERFVYDAYLNGRIVRLPYLGSLRVSPTYRNRIRLLREGYRVAHELLGDPREVPYALTSITADNERARRLLCAGIAGFPQYVPAGEMITFALRTRRTRIDPSVSLAATTDLPTIAAFLQEVYRHYQFAPVWRSEDLERIGASFLVIRRLGRIAACMALWDQSAVKQTRVCGYARPIELARPLINLFAPLAGAPGLPRAGSILKQIYVSHIAVRDAHPDDFRALLRAALSFAHQRGSELAVIGLSARHPLIDCVRRHWKSREYRSLLHIVQWPAERTGEAAAYPPPEPAPVPHPEIALL